MTSVAPDIVARRADGSIPRAVLGPAIRLALGSNDLAFSMLAVASLLGDKQLPIAVLTGDAAASEELFAAGDEDAETAALSELAAQGLVSLDGGLLSAEATITVHPIIADLVRYEIGRSADLDAGYLRSVAIRCIDRLHTRWLSDETTAPFTQLLTSHIEALAAEVENGPPRPGHPANPHASNRDRALVGRILARQASRLRMTGSFDAALDAVQRAVRLAEGDPLDPSTLMECRAELARVHQWAGRPADAAALQQTILDSLSVRVPHDPFALTIQADLATSLQWARDFDGAAVVLSDLLASHPLSDAETTLSALSRRQLRSNLSACHHARGRSDLAVALDELLLSEWTAIEGVDGPHTVDTTTHLAIALQWEQRTDEALVCWDEVVASLTRTKGADHPATLTALDHLADAYLWAGRHDDAARIGERVALDRDRVLGATSPDSLAAWTSQADRYHWAGRTADAIQVQERLCLLHGEVHGAEHPLTMSAEAALAVSYSWVNRIDEAGRLLSRVASTSDRVFGEGDRRTLDRFHQLGVLYARAGRLDQAVATLEWVATTAKRHLEEADETTRAAVADLADVLAFRAA